MKLETGMYVRTRDGIVKIAENVQELKNEGYVFIDNKAYYSYEIFKASFNLIDLIEVGDYVNEEIVKSVPLTKCVDSVHKGRWRIAKWTNEDIKSIVTKEQFKSVEYKVVE